MRCCPKEPARKIPRSIYENARDVARALGKTEGPLGNRTDRKRVETLFAHLKRILRLGHPCGAQDEFTLAAIAQNMRRPDSRCVRCRIGQAVASLRNDCLG
jgi:hypothetical protein